MATGPSPQDLGTPREAAFDTKCEFVSSAKNMNERSETITLANYIRTLEGWGTRDGAQLRKKLASQVESKAGSGVIRLSLQGMKRFDLAFAVEAIVGLIADHLGTRPICVVDLNDPDLRANLAAAARQQKLPIMAWGKAGGEALGLRPGSAFHQALIFVLAHGEVRATELVAETGVSISNASSRFNKLWSMGLLLRRKTDASSGGKEFIYQPVR